MTKCPNCDAIMTEVAADCDGLKGKPAPTTEDSMRFECVECGHREESLASVTQTTNH